VVHLRVDTKAPDAGPLLTEELRRWAEPVAEQELDIERKARSATAPPEDDDEPEPPPS